MNITDKREIIDEGKYDVIVVGGGIAGVSAAVAAAREGTDVLLVEKGILLGGLATVGLINWYEPLCDGNGRKMISGIAEELIRLSIRYGFDSLPKEWADGRNTSGSAARYASHFSPTIFAMALDGYLLDNRVKIRFDSLAVFPVMEENHCIGIVVESREGRVFFGAKVVIDATGDASILQKAGVPTASGINYLTYLAHGTSYDLACQYAKDKNMQHFRKSINLGSDALGNRQPESVKTFTGDTGKEITEFVLSGRKMLFNKLKDQDRNSRDIAVLPSMPQYRKIRHLVGEYDFTGKENNQRFNDSVGSIGDYRSAGKHYQIPYACLYHRNFDNLLAAGRIISASGEGWEITRVIPVAAFTGQAAGTAAALSIKSGTKVSKLDIMALQSRLKDNGVLFL